MPTVIFGWIVMPRCNGLQTCIISNLVLGHQFVTVLATIKERHVSSWGMSLIVPAVVIFGSTNANIYV